jgi:type IV secretion system protein TrbL
MKMSAILKYAAIPAGFALLLFSLPAQAQMSTDVLGPLMSDYRNVGTAWQEAVIGHATRLFFLLSTISLVFTFGFMAMRQADFGELFSELIRYVLFTVFFFWLLTNGPEFVYAIFDSLDQIGVEVTGNVITAPTNIVNIGFRILKDTLDQSLSLEWTEADKSAGILMSLFILITLALIAINIVLVTVSAWALAYGGVFLLGFGSSRWTSDIAVAYYKSVLGVAMSWLSMIILLSVGVRFLNNIKSQMGGTIALMELAIMMVAALALLVLTNKIPAMIAGIVTGARVGGALNVTGMVSATVVSGAAAMNAGIASAASNTQKMVSMLAASREEAARGNINTHTSSLLASMTGMNSSATMYSDGGSFFGQAQANQSHHTGGGLASAMGSSHTSAPMMTGIAGAVGTAARSAADMSPTVAGKPGQSSQTGAQGGSAGMPGNNGNAQGADKPASGINLATGAGSMQQSGSGMVNVAQPPVQPSSQSSSQTVQKGGAAPAAAGSGMVNVAQPPVQPSSQSSSQTTHQGGAAPTAGNAAGSGMVNVAQPPVQPSSQSSSQTVQKGGAAPTAGNAAGSGMVNVAQPPVQPSSQSSSQTTHQGGAAPAAGNTAGSGMVNVSQPPVQPSSQSSSQTTHQGGAAPAAGSTAGSSMTNVSQPSVPASSQSSSQTIQQAGAAVGGHGVVAPAAVAPVNPGSVQQTGSAATNMTQSASANTQQNNTIAAPAGSPSAPVGTVPPSNSAAASQAASPGSQQSMGSVAGSAGSDNKTHVAGSANAGISGSPAASLGAAGQAHSGATSVADKSTASDGSRHGAAAAHVPASPTPAAPAAGTTAAVRARGNADS